MSGAAESGGGGRERDLQRIAAALTAAGEVLENFTAGDIEARRKAGGDPVTEADLAVDAALRRTLPESGEGWLSEETRDDKSRLDCRRVWVVDPLDGTREFLLGLPEWCVSVGLVEDGEPVAGGILSPSTEQTILGSRETGVTVNGEPVTAAPIGSLADATVLASRSEFERGEWEAFADCDFTIHPMGSVAFKLGLVAAGEAAATWTLVPKHEWDVAAGMALILAAGGEIRRMPGDTAELNQAKPKLRGLVGLGAGTAGLWGGIEERWVPLYD